VFASKTKVIVSQDETIIPNLSLNVTAQLDKVTARLGMMTFDTNTSILFLLLVITLAGLASVKARQLAQWAAAQVIVYVLLGMETKERLGSKKAVGLKGSKSMSSLSRPRKSFGLESTLERCNLERTIRRQAATRLENTLMNATLEQAMLGKTNSKDVPKSAKKGELEINIFPRFPNLLSFTCEETSYNNSETSCNNSETSCNTRWDAIPGKRSFRGSKPDRHKVVEMRRKLSAFDLDGDEELAVHSYEDEPRARAVTTGDNFDGEEVGDNPRWLKLPKPARGPVRFGFCGRSILQVPWEQIIKIHENKLLKMEMPPVYNSDWCTELLRHARLA
jgi:hypothetical protein